MVVTVSPALKDVSQTLNALQFASTVRKAHVGPAKRQTQNHPTDRLAVTVSGRQLLPMQTPRPLRR